MNTDMSGQAATVSLFKKRVFLQQLSEDDFRDRVVRPLLLRQGLKDGRDTCGPTENGKDAVFLTTNALGLQEVYVVQTKKGRLNMSRNVTQNVVEATTQLRTALTTKIPFIATREKKLPDKAILCASGLINEAARNHIVSEISDRGLMFLDPDELIPLIDKHYPELWWDIDASVRPYLRALRRVVESVEEDLVPELGSQAMAGAATDRMFVTLYLNRTEVKIKKRSGRVEREPELVELPVHAVTKRRERLILITGGAGSGKSTTLRRLAYILVQRHLSARGAEEARVPIPVLLKATALATTPAPLLQALIDETRRLADSTKPAFSSEDLRDGRVVVLVDALDELADDNVRATVLQRVLDFHSLYPKCQAVLTSRDYSFVGMIAELTPFTRFNLSPISLNQAGQLLEKIRRNRQLPLDASKEIMRRLKQVHGFELNPLLVTVFAATSDVSRKDIPANITELFKKYTEMMLGRWSQSKGLGQQFHAPLKDFLLRHVAFEMHRRLVTSLPLTEFTNMLSGALSARGHSAEIDVLLDELLHQSGLFRIIDDAVEFRHLLLQEFFAGRGITSIEGLDSLIHEDWWQRAIVFFFGEHPDDIKGLESARNAMGPKTEPERYRAAITLGIALQACYLVEMKGKVDIYKWVLQVLAKSKHGFVEGVKHAGAPEFIAFVWYFLFGREAVACSLPSGDRQTILEQLKEQAVDQDEADTCEFWELIGSIETAFEETNIEKSIARYNPEDRRLLFGVYLTLRFHEKLRMASVEERRLASRVAGQLQARVMSVAKEFDKQFKSMILEVRGGQVKEIETGEEVEDKVASA